MNLTGKMKTTHESPPYAFQNRRRQPEFIVKSDRKLTKKQLNQIARLVIQQHKKMLFEGWKLCPKNQKWRGNVSSKMKSLMRAEPLPNPVILEKAFTRSLLKG